MVRASAVVLLLAVVALAGSAFAWMRATSVVTEGNPDAFFQAFVRDATPEADVDLAARYAGRAELLDPRLALPRWHAHPRGQAAAVFFATRDCAAPAPAALPDASLAKAWAWHERTCRNEDITELLARPPFVHPSGRSYAALAVARGGPKPALAAGLHVVELAHAPPAMLDRDAAALAAISPAGWQALARGDRLVLERGAVLVADQGAFGLARVRSFDRRAFDAEARRASLALVPRQEHAFCTHPASPGLCWENVTRAERHRALLGGATAGSAGLALVAAATLVIGLRRERQRAHADRLHVLRTLTHELRTPATSLGIDIEPLRAAYDEIPAACQEPLLRISDGIARLNRVLHRTARYLELFERTTTLDTRRVEVSARAMFEEMAGEWPEGVRLDGPEGDATLSVDVDWLSVAVRNLTENAVRHGKPPAVVTWSLAGDDLVVTVRDGGTSEGLRMGETRSETREGLGLGLAIVQRVATLLGGTLTHAPSPTTFVLRIPARPRS